MNVRTRLKDLVALPSTEHDEHPSGLGTYEDKVAKAKGKARVIWNNLKGKKSRGIIGEDEDAGLRGRLPGCEPQPYIIRFTEDRPNPLYRRVCYTTAWGEVIAFAVLNIAGLAFAVMTGEWRLKQMYEVAYFPIAGTMWLLGALGYLPRVKRSTKGEGHERRYFYGSVWAVAIGQPILWLMWKVLPQTRTGDIVKLAVFVAILAVVGQMSRLGLLPRTRPIVPGELAVSD